MGVLDTLAGATANRRTEDIIVNAALADEHARLRRQLDDAITADLEHQTAHEQALAAAAEHDEAHGSMEDPHPKIDALLAEPFEEQPNLTRAIDALEAIRDKVAASTVTFTLDPVDWRDRIRLQAEHPPREGNLIDARFGYNGSTYPPALVRESTTSVTGADGDVQTEIPAATWTHLFGDPEADPPIKPTLNFEAVNRLTTAAQNINDGAVPVPPSARSLLGTQDSGASSTSPSPGASPQSGSAAGSRRTSPKSSTTKKATSTRGKSAAT